MKWTIIHIYVGDPGQVENASLGYVAAPADYATSRRPIYETEKSARAAMRHQFGPSSRWMGYVIPVDDGATSG
jgi:hypothetical protein